MLSYILKRRTSFQSQLGAIKTQESLKRRIQFTIKKFQSQLGAIKTRIDWLVGRGGVRPFQSQLGAIKTFYNLFML